MPMADWPEIFAVTNFKCPVASMPAAMLLSALALAEENNLGIVYDKL